MPPPSSRMTKNQVRNIRYRPGKEEADDRPDFESESDSGSEEDGIGKQAASRRQTTAAPRATTFPPRKKLPPARVSALPKRPDIDLEGYVTASESSEEDEDDGKEKQSSVKQRDVETDEESEDDDEDEDTSDDDDEDDEDSSSEEEQKPRLIAPKFISKAQRHKLQSTQSSKTEDERFEEEERKRQEKADQLLQAQIEKDKALRAAGKKAWDDDDNAAEDEVDDTDGLDPEAEHAAWKLRELKRVQRDRQALIQKEKELEEIERRKNLTAEEREAEDREFLEQQKADQEGKGKMAYMQKYFHKGAFFNGDEDQDDEVKAALSRDLAGARFVDETSKDLLPEYMRIRDMTMLGRKGRTRYKDLKSEDTGRFGDFGSRKQKFDGVDDRFREDHDSFRDEQKTGANAAPVGTRRRREDDGAGQSEKRSRHE